MYVVNAKTTSCMSACLFSCRPQYELICWAEINEETVFPLLAINHLQKEGENAEAKCANATNCKIGEKASQKETK